MFKILVLLAFVLLIRQLFKSLFLVSSNKRQPAQNSAQKANPIPDKDIIEGEYKDVSGS